MKIYEFKCESCGKIFESSIVEAKQLSCKSCGSENIKRIFSTPGLIKEKSNFGGKTCCGRDERCDVPPCGENGTCIR